LCLSILLARGASQQTKNMYHRCPREDMTAHPPNLYVGLLYPLPSARGTDRRDAADGAAIYRLLLLLKTPSYVALLYT